MGTLLREFLWLLELFLFCIQDNLHCPGRNRRMVWGFPVCLQDWLSLALQLWKGGWANSQQKHLGGSQGQQPCSMAPVQRSCCSQVKAAGHSCTQSTNICQDGLSSGVAEEVFVASFCVHFWDETICAILDKVDTKRMKIKSKYLSINIIFKVYLESFYCSSWAEIFLTHLQLCKNCRQLFWFHY